MNANRVISDSDIFVKHDDECLNDEFCHFEIGLVNYWN